MNGYVPMGDLNPATRDEAIDKEYNTFGGKDVDFEVKIQGNGVNVPVYNGPGEKFDEVSGSNGIADETTVHILSMSRAKMEQTGEKQIHRVLIRVGLILTAIQTTQLRMLRQLRIFRMRQVHQEMFQRQLMRLHRRQQRQ